MPSATNTNKTPTPVGPSATLVYQPVGARDTLIVRNEGGHTAFLGQSSVTSTTGLPLVAGEQLVFTRVPFAIYAVAASGTGPVLSVTAGVS